MQKMDGSVFSPGFNATYALEINVSGSSAYTDQLNLLPGGTASYVGTVGLTGGIGSSQNIQGTGIKLGVNNTNAAGVNGDTGTAASASAAQAVSTGLEIGIPLSLLGDPTGNILVMADINGSGDNYLSNQFLPGLPTGTGNLGDKTEAYSTSNPSVFNLSTLTGSSSEYFTVPNVVVPNGIWLPPGGGSWGSPTTNWTNGYVPGVVGDSASFASATGSSTVTLDGDRTVGSITFNNSNAYTIAQGTSGYLTLDNGGVSATASVTDVSGNHTISAL